ncbi:hypothetical protein V8D89_009724 [Ganoderma adspersum]
MSDKLSSPNRGPSKVTYAGARTKRRKSVRDATFKPSADGPDDDDSEGEPATESPQKATRPETRMSTRTPKKVDVHLPGPSPKRDTDASAKKPASVRGKRGTHSRAGSVASLAREDTLVDVSPSKPQSAKPRSQIKRTDTLEDDEESSAGGTFGTGRYSARKGEAERRQFLEDDPNSGEIEPHRIYCKACSEWVDLNPKLKFIMKLWIEHRKRCQGIDLVESPTKEKEKASTEPEEDNASVAEQSVLESASIGIKRVKKEEDRKAIIEADPLSGEVKTDTAFCKGCQSWVKLSTVTTYSLHHWRNHSNKCNSGVPSSRVATAQRKLSLVNDSQVKIFTTQSVDCKLCNSTVELEGKADYDTTKWEEHKATCTSGLSNGVVAKVAAVETPAPSLSRPPPSVTDTEETAVATDVPSTPQKRTKRSREEEDAPERSVRARDTSYEPPQGENPGFVGWIADSIKSFFRSFREGLAG